MSDEIGYGGASQYVAEEIPARTLVPLQIGTATVYIEQVGTPAAVVAHEEIHVVAALDPRQAFQTASEFLHECIATVGERLAALGEHGPQEVSVEFSLSFEAAGKAQLIPIFVTGETKAATGLKVKAVWKPDAGRG
jgi:hypothetical protein